MPFGKSYVTPVRFLILMWAIFYIDLFLPYDLAAFGIYPRTVHGLVGILFAPLIHGNLLHLISNSIPILFLGIVLYMFYGSISDKVFFQGYFYTNILVWIFGRSSLHIGASGLVYCIASFLIFYGFFRKDLISIMISFLSILSSAPAIRTVTSAGALYINFTSSSRSFSKKFIIRSLILLSNLKNKKITS